MTRHDWILTGTALLFTGAGLLCWRAADPTELLRTALGAFPIALGLSAFLELARRGTR